MIKPILPYIRLTQNLFADKIGLVGLSKINFIFNLDSHLSTFSFQSQEAEKGMLKVKFSIPALEVFQSALQKGVRKGVRFN